MTNICKHVIYYVIMVSFMERTQIQLTGEQAAKLKRLSGIRHCSMANLIREAVDKYVRSEVVVDDEEKRRRARAAAGCASSGLGDLAENHDKYLAEAFDK